MIEGEQAPFDKRKQELDREERIAAGLVMDELREWRGALRRAVKRVRQQLPEIILAKRRKRDLHDLASRRPDLPEHAGQSMSDVDLIGAISADQHEVLQMRPGQQIIEQHERRRIKPLQIIEEEHQRMVLARKHPDKALEHVMEAALRLLQRKLWNRQLLADDDLQLGNEVDDQLSLRAKRIQDRAAPLAQLHLRLAQQRPNKALKRLSESRVGHIALMLVELAGCEQSPRRHQHLVQL